MSCTSEAVLKQLRLTKQSEERIKYKYKTFINKTDRPYGVRTFELQSRFATNKILTKIAPIFD